MDRRPYAFALRAALWGLLLVATAQLASPLLPEVPWLFRASLPEVARDVGGLRAADGAVAWLGDSVVGWGTYQGEPETTLPARLAEATGLPVVDLSHPANGPAILAAQLAAARRLGARPRALLVPINLRAYGPLWTHNPSWNFTLRRWMLETGAYLPLRGLGVFKLRPGHLPEPAYRALPIVVGGEAVGHVGDLWEPPDSATPEEQARRYLLASYATDLRRSPAWPAYRELLDRLRQSDVPTVAYLTPLDHELLAATLTAEERALVAENLELLRREAERQGVRLLDFTTALPHPRFDHHDPARPAEHLDREGRRQLAEDLAPHVLRVRW